MKQNITKELLGFLDNSPTPFHVIANFREMLKGEGYTELCEGQEWKLDEGGKYFVARNESSIIAFRIPSFSFSGFQMAAAHSDSPCFKIKGEKPEMEAGKEYIKLNVEQYGGMIMAPWFDRPLSVAGRVIAKKDGKLLTKLVKIDRDMMIIPNVAIHMNRDINNGYKYNVQEDLLPIYGDGASKGGFMKQIAEAAGVDFDEMAGSDIFLYSRTPASVWGANGEYFSAGHIDDLECAFTAMKGFLTAKENKNSVPMVVIFDNEEVGSETKQGADSTFLSDTVERIGEACKKTRQQLKAAFASSLMLSADNAHAVHPNHPEKCDPVNRPEMNKGIVIKHNANQKYTTDAVSAAMFKEICARVNVPYQEFVNRSDMAGGSTLGNISNAHVSLNSVDIGLAQLAMHSPYETAGVKDIEYMTKVMEEFFGLAISDDGQGNYSFIG